MQMDMDSTTWKIQAFAVETSTFYLYFSDSWIHIHFSDVFVTIYIRWHWPLAEGGFAHGLVP
jgi:hypothetical protein